MVMTNQTATATHRTGLTGADSGNTPSSWSDAPSAITDMAGGRVLRLFPRVTAGAVTEFKFRILTVNGSNNHLSSQTTITTDTTSLVDLEGYSGSHVLYVKVDEITGGGTLALDYAVVTF